MNVNQHYLNLKKKYSECIYILYKKFNISKYVRVIDGLKLNASREKFNHTYMGITLREN